LNLKNKLEYHYKFFDKDKISPDPVEFLHRYKNYFDIEISGIISSVFAYGNVKQINQTLLAIHSLMNYKPYEFVMNYSYSRDKKYFNKIVHRFYTSDDIAKFFYALNKIYVVYHSLKYFFLLYHFSEEKNLKSSISFFSKNILELIGSQFDVSSGIKFMFPDPFKGSACKRINLFLRWMVRKDDIDFGLWSEISKAKLVIPVDTHVAKICRSLGLTKRKNISWLMAEEITEKLKKFDPDDPVKYDFAICHIGMRKMKF